MEKFALITGASSGIGRALAFELASMKHNVLLVALPNTGLLELVQEIRTTFGVDADGYEVDLTDADAVQKIYCWCQLNYYQINMLINNAGFGNLCAFDKTDPQVIRNMMILNNQALVFLTHRFLPELKKNRTAHLLNVGSLASFMSVPNKSVYAASKSFVYSFSLALRMELQFSGVSVSCLCPGGTLTSSQVRERMQAVKINRRFVQFPEEVARAAVKGLLQRKFLIIPGVHNRILYRVSRFLPGSWTCWILQQIFNRKRAEENFSKSWKPSSVTAMVLLYR